MCRGRGRPERSAVQFPIGKKNASHADEPDDYPEAGGESKRNADHDSASRDGGEPPKESANEGIDRAEVQSGLGERNPDECRMFHRQENPRNDGDAGEEKKSRREPVAKKEE